MRMMTPEGIDDGCYKKVQKDREGRGLENL